MKYQFRHGLSNARIPGTINLFCLNSRPYFDDPIIVIIYFTKIEIFGSYS